MVAGAERDLAGAAVAAGLEQQPIGGGVLRIGVGNQLHDAQRWLRLVDSPAFAERSYGGDALRCFFFRPSPALIFAGAAGEDAVGQRIGAGDDRIAER